MLQFEITNDQQQDQLSYSESCIIFGRKPPEDGPAVTIDDKYVSRDQFKLDDVDNGMVRISNRGRAKIKVTGGDEIPQGESKILGIPALLTVGRSAVKITPMEAEEE